ncbi:hypothetical protein J437_LFUL007802 [Ladona fulva]|uniref:Protoporphyrinogen oxidase n=1 Tax=Ladona fulva TaxID=123851 RepID=A0A8K0NU37_LADFU|nr:hypothetical protein J437_LFUL007802 [Ladona fulva]
MVTVLGGGVSGLAAAHYLLNRSLLPGEKISLIEATAHLGGWMKSTRRPNNVIYEQGPRTIRPKGVQGANTLKLVEELGLSNKVKPIPYGHPATMNRMIYVDKKLHKLPTSMFSLFQKKEPFDKPLVFAALKFLTSPKEICNDDTMYNFVARRFGKDIAEYAISPLICGICAGDAKEISVKFLMRKLFEAEQSQSPMLKEVILNLFAKTPMKDYESELLNKAKEEKWNVYSLEGGLELLPRTLEESLKERGVSIHLNAPCTSITFEGNGVKVKTGRSEHFSDHLISALPALKLAPLLHPQHPDLSEELYKIPFVTVGVVNLTFPKNVLREEAFGFLVPPSQKVPILGIVYDSCCFPSDCDQTVLTVMMGGRFMDDHFGGKLDDAVALQTAVKYSKEILKINDDPCDHKVSILRECIPQYVVGHDKRLQRIYKYIKDRKIPLTLVGCSYEGVGVNDAIFSSKRGIDNIKLKIV